MNYNFVLLGDKRNVNSGVIGQADRLAAWSCHVGKRGATMTGGPVSEFLRSAGDKPYRNFVEHHIRKQPTEQLRNAGVGEILLLPEDFQPFVEVFIDAVNGRLGYDRAFWRRATWGDEIEKLDEFRMPLFCKCVMKKKIDVRCSGIRARATWWLAREQGSKPGRS